MILVTLGTQDKSFERLLKQIDKEIDKGTIKDKVIVQAGHTKYNSKNMEIFTLVTPNELEEYIKNCDLLITHGGVGSILSGLKYGKKIIAVPRLSKYGEHNNDHQLQLIDKFSSDGYIIPCYEVKDLEESLKKTKDFVVKKYKSNNYKFVNLIKNYIDSL